MQNKTAAIVVSFHPEIDSLNRLLDALKKQVDGIIVIDNGSSPEIISWLFKQSLESRLHLLSLGDNFGIGFAQNRGIELAQDQGYEKFLLLDQDSFPAPELVATLERALEQLTQAGVRVGAVGPIRDDENDSSPTYFLRFDRFPPRRLQCSHADPLIHTDVLISSGMLIPGQAVKDVGLMDERLFIDHVDTEWCLRGLARGHSFFGVCEARLQHKLGTRAAKLWLGRWHDSTIHIPLRNYYYVRNSVILIRRSYISRTWKWYMAWRLLRFCVRNCLISPRMLRLLMMIRGFSDALLGRLGRLN